MIKKQNLVLLILFVFSLPQMANANLYLFSASDIPVLRYAKKNSETMHQLKGGETFEVIRWNNFHSRIRLSDGTEGFIERSLLESVIRQVNPDILESESDNRENLPRPLKLTVTSDETLLIRQNAIPTSAPLGAGNAENPSGNVNEDLPDLDTGEFEGNSSEASAQREDFKSYTEDQYDFMLKFGLATWKNAIEKRKVAKFMGKGFKKGNRSKGKCSTAVRESFIDSGICRDYSGNPLSIDAVNMHKENILKSYCPKLKLSKDATEENPLSGADIAAAPGGSVIVYSGYAGKTPHEHGHIEIKVPITAELKKKMGKDALDYEVGDYMYCSDYCRATPTVKSTNKIEAIYTLK